MLVPFVRAATRVARLTPVDALTLLEELRMGHTSVTVLSDVTETTRAVMHCEDELCALKYDHGIEGSASIHRILMSDPEDPGRYSGSLSAFTQAVESWLPGSIPGITAGWFFCVDGDYLHTVSIDRNVRPKLVPRRLQINGTPVRVIYSSHLGRLIILYNKSLAMTDSRHPNVNHVARTKRILLSRIAFRTPYHESDTQHGPDAMDIDAEHISDENDALLDAEQRLGERFIGVTEWFPRVDGKQYHMLVLNTSITRVGMTKPSGRLLFLAISQNASGSPKLTMKKRLELDGPVYSVAVYPDGRSIVYSCGSDLCIQSLDPGPSGVKWQPSIKAAMRSPARYITIAEPLIYVSSTRESLAVYRYGSGKLMYQYGDQSARDGIHHLHVPELSLTLASDMNHTVVGLWQPPERRIDNAMSTVFEAVLPSSIARLNWITKPAWYQDTSIKSDNQIIIGSSADGTIRRFDILTKGWKVLRFIQNMAERNPLLCPFAGNRPFKRHVEPSTTRPHHMHINGDILMRVLDRGGETCIRDMLNVEPDLESHTDFDSVQDRWARFRELAGELVDVEDEGWLGRLIKVLGRRLRSAF